MTRPACFISTGSVLIDVPLRVKFLPTPGGAVNAVSHGMTVGGCYTVVSAVARQGIPAALASTLGTGTNSVLVRRSLEADGIELLVDELVGDIGACTALIEPNGRRTYVTTHGVEIEPQIADLERIEFVTGDWVFASGYDLMLEGAGTLAQWLLDLPDHVKLIIDLGPVEAQIADAHLTALLRRANMVTGDDNETTRLVERVGGRFALREACPQAILVRRRGVDGCVVWSADGERIEIPGFPRHVVDSTGAGDTHTGVLTACLMEGMDLESAAYRANAASAQAATRMGGDCAPGRGDIDALLAETETLLEPA